MLHNGADKLYPRHNNVGVERSCHETLPPCKDVGRCNYFSVLAVFHTEGGEPGISHP